MDNPGKYEVNVVAFAEDHKIKEVPGLQAGYCLAVVQVRHRDHIDQKRFYIAGVKVKGETTLLKSGDLEVKPLFEVTVDGPGWERIKAPGS